MRKYLTILSLSRPKKLAWLLLILPLTSFALPNFFDNSDASLPQRIEAISQQLLNTPYQASPTGDGAQAQFDQRPLWRLDAFDCMTYVESVLALSLAHTMENVDGQVRLIRYTQQPPSFFNRNHFVSLDWNPHQHRQHLLRDITLDIQDQVGKPLAKTAQARINKPDWYAALKPETLQPKDKMSRRRRRRLLKALHQHGTTLHSQTASLNYLPLRELFDHDGQPIEAIFSQIPSGTIIEIVRPNWDLRNLIGTHLLVSHMGFAIRTTDGLMLRHASSTAGKVIDQPLATYLQQYLDKKTTVGGIHLEQVTPA